MFGRIVSILLFGLLSGPVFGAGGDVVLKSRNWSFSGPFGTFDKAAMQRGFQVYNEVCAGCHSMKLIAFRNRSKFHSALMNNCVKKMSIKGAVEKHCSLKVYDISYPSASLYLFMTCDDDITPLRLSSM